MQILRFRMYGCKYRRFGGYAVKNPKKKKRGRLASLIDCRHEGSIRRAIVPDGAMTTPKYIQTISKGRMSIGFLDLKFLKLSFVWYMHWRTGKYIISTTSNGLSCMIHVSNITSLSYTSTVVDDCVILYLQNKSIRRTLPLVMYTS